MKATILANCKLQDLTSAPTFGALLQAYARESSLPGLPTPEPNLGAYQALEDEGLLKTAAAYDGDTLVGFISAQLVNAPQYNATVGMTLAFFVEEKHRAYGTARHLIDALSTVLKCYDAKGLVIGAPSESRLAKAANLLGFHETNRLYFKGFS